MSGRSSRAYDLHPVLPGHQPDDDESLEAGDQLRALRIALARDYVPLLRKLTRALRSRDKAIDALHDVYLRLHAPASIGTVRQPFAYIVRMALNRAHNGRVREARFQNLSDAATRSLVDDAPGPERAALARADLDRLLAALDSLPHRRRAIYLARWRDDLSQAEIAAAFGLHKRTVQKELARAERTILSASKLR